MVRIEAQCLKDGEVTIEVVIAAENVKFAFKKRCEKLHTRYLNFYTKGGDLVAVNGVTMPAFNVHEAQEVSYIASEVCYGQGGVKLYSLPI